MAFRGMWCDAMLKSGFSWGTVVLGNRGLSHLFGGDPYECVYSPLYGFHGCMVIVDRYSCYCSAGLVSCLPKIRFAALCLPWFRTTYRAYETRLRRRHASPVCQAAKDQNFMMMILLMNFGADAAQSLAPWGIREGDLSVLGWRLGSAELD